MAVIKISDDKTNLPKVIKITVGGGYKLYNVNSQSIIFYGSSSQSPKICN